MKENKQAKYLKPWVQTRCVHMSICVFRIVHRGRVRERMCKNRMRPLVYAVDINAISKCTDVEFSVGFEVLCVWCVCVLIFFSFGCSRSIVHFTIFKWNAQGVSLPITSVCVCICVCAHSVVFFFVCTFQFRCEQHSIANINCMLYNVGAS